MGKVNTIAAGTYIGFSGNKTVLQAKSDTDTNRVDITETGELYFNGVRIGTNASEEKFLNSINSDGRFYHSSVMMADGSSIKSYIDTNVAEAKKGAYKFLGTVENFEDAFTKTNVVVGSIFNVKNKFTINEGEHKGTYPAGTNVAVNTAYNGSGTEANFDPLGGVTTDLSDYVTLTKLGNILKTYVTTSSLDTKLANYVTNDALTKKLASYREAFVFSESSLPAESPSSTSFTETEKAFIEQLVAAIQNDKMIIVKVQGTTDGLRHIVVTYRAVKELSNGDYRITINYKDGSLTYTNMIETVNGKTGYKTHYDTYQEATKSDVTSLRDRVTALEERLKLV